MFYTDFELQFCGRTMKIRLPEMEKKTFVFDNFKLLLSYDDIIFTYCVVSILISAYIVFKKTKKD